jgi:ATP synthase subunit 6
MFSPLEQFEVSLVLPYFSWMPSWLVVTNTQVYTLLLCSFFFLLSYIAYSKPKVVAGRWQAIFEMFYVFILDMLKAQAGMRAYAFFPLFIFMFIFILLSNLIGLMPFAFTLTAQIIVTFFFALSFNLGFIFLGFYLHNLRFLTLFVPSGVPTVLLPLIVVIEVISYLIRTFSLSLRLFANMMAGHTSLHILSSFVVAFLVIGGLLVVVAIVPFLLVLAVMVLEIGIAFLQAYVFTILLCIYANDAINLH